MTEVELLKLNINNSLKSPEIVELFYLVRNIPVPNFTFPEESVVLDNFTEITDEVFVHGKGGLFSQLVDASGIDKLGNLFS